MPILIGVSPWANVRTGGEKIAVAPIAAPVLMTVLRLGFQRDVVIVILPRTLFVRIMKTKKRRRARRTLDRARHDAVSPEVMLMSRCDRTQAQREFRHALLSACALSSYDFGTSADNRTW
jgi:hypothetical protein